MTRPRIRLQQRAATGAVPVVRRRGEEGYNLVMLIVAITIMNVMVAVALPRWSYVIRRDREEEAIFRGLQYAEAIRVFRQRNGRYPVALEELIKVEPRSIRQLWTEPLTADGEFGLVVEAPPQQGANPGQPGAPPGAPGTPGAAPTPGPVPVEIPGGGRPSFGGIGIGGTTTTAPLIKLPRGAKDASGKSIGKTVTSGPLAIHGVYLDLKGESLRKFFGKDKYEEWAFVAEMIAPPVTAAGRPLPRVRDDWVGKTFAEGLSPVLGSGAAFPGSPQPGTELGGGAGKPGQAPGTKRTDRPKPEPGTPSEFPEDVPPEVPEEDVVPNDTMRDEEPFPEEDPSTEDPDDEPSSHRLGDDQGAR